MNPELTDRRVIVRYTGPIGGLLYAIASQWPSGLDQDDFDCTLTASIARHPAGKGIPPGRDSDDDRDPSPGGPSVKVCLEPGCWNPAADFNSAGVHHSADCVRSGE